MNGSSLMPVIWVVDDSPLDAERARRALAGHCRVEVFHDGSAALERLASGPAPAVMVLDWVMPGVTGVEVCRFLRSAEGRQPGVGVLLLTSHRATEQIVEGLSAGANDYLAKPYADEELVARVGALLRARDLLERAEQAEALNRTLLETAPDPLLAVDEATRVTFANEAAGRTLGWPPSTLMGRPLGDILPGIVLSEAASAHSALPDVQVGDRLFSPSVRALPSGKESHAILSLRDVTERHRANARRLDFYSIIAHDLRSPLTAISMRTYRLGRNRDLAPDMLDDIQKIEQSIASLTAMVDDFLELAQFEGSDYRIERKPLDITLLLARTMDDFVPLLEATELTWIHEPKPRVPVTVMGDARRLQQVLANLIGNAVKFTPSHGTITTSVSSVGDDVIVAITDTGRGIAPDALTTIFNRYTRAPDRQQQPVPGSGLGLMITREIIEAHGGRVGVESTPGQGSRFWFRVPSA
jgi:signal transduction histidine kinase